MISRLLCWATLLWLWMPTAWSAPLGPPGTLATYAVHTDLSQRPEFEREHRLTVVEMKLGLGPAEVRDGRESQWLLLSFARLNSQTYRAWLLMDAWPRTDYAPQVARYLWLEPDWPDAVEFVNAVTGEAQLPRLALWQHGWPQSIGGGPLAVAHDAFPEAVQFQGHPFMRATVETGQDVTPPTDRTIVRLNPDLIIGHMTRSTDIHGKPFWALPDGKYEYRQTTPEDHRRHFEAGFNLYQATPRTDWLTRSSAWDNNLFWLMDDWPAQLYRSNYWGRGIYVDEPAINNRGVLNRRLELAGKLTPVEAVSALQEHLRSALRRPIGNYSQRWINVFIDQQFGRGNLWIEERDYPVWEAIWTTAWYQLAMDDGVVGIVDEDTGMGDLVESYNRAFGTQIPPTVQNACAIRVAVMRGAARNFGKRWGVAFYSPAESRLKASSIPILYDKGASYFWVWTGWEGIGDNSGLPHSYQRHYASLVRQAQAANPRRDMDALLRAARTCIVIPYGYTFAPYPMHWVQWLHLERQTGHDASYRQVLMNAALEVERCLRLGIDFDIAVDAQEFTATGYDELIFCREDGSVVVRAQGAETRLPGGREPARPDLGPGPTIAIETPDAPPAAPSRITLKALATAGTGEFENDGPLVSWEVYGPDQGVLHRNGETVEFDLPVGGLYRIRAAVADVFGRPAVAWTELQIGDSWRDAVALPAEWAFRKDPNNVGVEQEWFAALPENGDWMAVRVPAFLRYTEVGSYLGHGWYSTVFTVPGEWAGQRILLRFGAVDEQAWVYLNGQYVGEHTVASEGVGVGELWDKPFTIEVEPAAVRFGEENHLVVRMHASAGQSGIWGDVKVYLPPDD